MSDNKLTPSERIANAGSGVTPKRSISRTPNQVPLDNTGIPKKASEMGKVNNAGSPLPNKASRPKEQPPLTNEQPPVTPPKKKSKLPLILGIMGGVAVLGIGGVFVYNKFIKEKPLVAQTWNFEGSGLEALQNFVEVVHTKDPYAIDDAVGTTDADSYLAHEIAYANANEKRTYFVERVYEVFDIDYTESQVLSTTGILMTNEDGSPLMESSAYNNGEDITITIPDYDKISATMQEDIENIQKMYEESGIKETDLDYRNEMIDFMVVYVTNIQELPTTTVTVPTILTGSVGNWSIESDVAIDNALFGNEALRNMCDVFSQVCTGYQSSVVVTEDNAEYTEFMTEYNKLKATDSDRCSSITEDQPVLDEDGYETYDEDGNVITESVTILTYTDEDGVEHKQPSKTITYNQDVEWTPESVIPYNWCGSYYIQNEYDGVFSTVVTVGDGTKDNPAGLNTGIITKMPVVKVKESTLGTATITQTGEYADVEVALASYWVGQEAVDYLKSLSQQNNGFSNESKLELFVCEFAITNKSDKEVTIGSDAMLLGDNGFPSAKSSNAVWGLTRAVTLKPGETGVINDWFTSTDLNSKYLVWGESFDLPTDRVYFAVLADTPEIPSYSPYRENVEAVLGYYGTEKYNNMEINSTTEAVTEEEPLSE